MDAGIGLRLRARRQALGINATALARALSVHRNTVHQVEGAKNGVSVDLFCRWCQVLGMSPGEVGGVLYGEAAPTSSASSASSTAGVDARGSVEEEWASGVWAVGGE